MATVACNLYDLVFKTTCEIRRLSDGVEATVYLNMDLCRGVAVCVRVCACVCVGRGVVGVYRQIAIAHGLVLTINDYSVQSQRGGEMSRVFLKTNKEEIGKGDKGGLQGWDGTLS